jgi:hypothetical protein
MELTGRIEFIFHEFLLFTVIHIASRVPSVTIESLLTGESQHGR